MSASSQRAWARLSIATAALAALAIFACRPAWSPDGRHLLFPMLTGPEQVGVGVYSRDTGTAALLSRQPAAEKFGAMGWSADGKTAVIVTTEKDKGLRIDAHPFPGGGEPRTWRIAKTKDEYETFVLPILGHGDSVFLTQGGIARLDLTTGAQKRSAAAEGRSLVVGRRGDGLCYVAMGKGEHETDWELGSLDPDSLERTPLLRAPAAGGWKVMPLPAFTDDLTRTALPGHRGRANEEHAILVFQNGELENVLELGSEQLVGVSSVAWATDGVTLLVGLCRRYEQRDVDSYSLLETTFSGSVTRETPIVTVRRGKDDEAPSLMFPMALSPDRKLAAFSTAMVEHARRGDHGLYLLDLSDKERKVTRIPFPGAENW